MTEQHGKIDRRTLLKLMGAAGASATGMSAGASWGTPSAAQASGVAQTGIDSFEIQVGDDELEDLGRRLATTRWPGRAPGEAWAYGTDRAYLEELVSYWRDHFDWRVHEAELNSFNHYTTTIEGQPLHFVHHEGRGGIPAATADGLTAGPGPSGRCSHRSEG